MNLTDLYFCSIVNAKNNLQKEQKYNIHVINNIQIDLMDIISAQYNDDVLKKYDLKNKYVLMIIHRDYNTNKNKNFFEQMQKFLIKFHFRFIQKQKNQ